MIDDNDLINIAHAIRNKMITTDTYTPEEMAAAIKSLTPEDMALFNKTVSDVNILDASNSTFYYVIPSYCFQNNDVLKTISIRNLGSSTDLRVEFRPSSCYNTSNLTSVIVQGSNDDRGYCIIRNSAFMKSGLINFSCNNLDSIEVKGFQACSNLDSVNIQDSEDDANNAWVLNGNKYTGGSIGIGDKAFYQCSSFRGFFKNNAFATFSFTAGKQSFYRCSNLKFLYCRNVGEEAFAYSGLKGVLVTNSIRGYAFDGCSNLDLWVMGEESEIPSISSSADPVYLHTDALTGCSIKNIYVPTALVSKYKSDASWGAYSSKIVGSDLFNTPAGIKSICENYV